MNANSDPNPDTRRSGAGPFIGHGKLILFGEHGVVHGRPALAAAVARGVTLHASPRENARGSLLRVQPWGLHLDLAGEPPSDAGARQLFQAMRVARELAGDGPELVMDADVSVPGGAGMGSSAALGVAVLKAFDHSRSVQRSDEEQGARALDWEKVFHGNPSGVDNTMAACGGVAVFTRGEPLRRLQPGCALRLIVGHSGHASSTKEMVASVARQFEAAPGRVTPLFEGMRECVVAASNAISAGEVGFLGPLMARNHELLRQLSLSTPALDEMCDVACAAGALGAKVTGAGGGGCMIALVNDDDTAQRVRSALEKLGKQAFDVETDR